MGFWNKIEKGWKRATDWTRKAARDVYQKVAKPAYNEIIKPGYQKIETAVSTVYKDVSGVVKKQSDGAYALETGLGKGLSSPLAIAAIGAVAFLVLRK